MTKTKQLSRIGLLDRDSGEVIDEGSLVYVPKKIRMKEGWFMAMQDGLEMLAKEPLRGESMRVLLYLMSKMDYENFMRPTVGEIAEALSMKKQNASRAIKELRERQIVIDGPHASMRLESSYGWRGKVKTLREHQHAEQRDLNRANAKEDDEATA
jgi:DNA-binding MarR family transcriptional regulator